MFCVHSASGEGAGCGRQTSHALEQNSDPHLRALSSTRKINVVEVNNFSKGDKVNSQLWLLKRSEVVSFTLGRENKTAIQFNFNF